MNKKYIYLIVFIIIFALAASVAFKASKKEKLLTKEDFGASKKRYAIGVGMIFDDGMLLTNY